jgi:hypothetical protein
MAIIEKFAKQEKEARRTLGGEPLEREEIKGPSLKQILANNEQADLFGEYLNEEGDEELSRKLFTGELGRDEMIVLTEKRKGFLEILERSKNISEALDARTIQELGGSFPEVQQVIDLVGPEGIRNALKRHLPRIAITSRAEFDALDQVVTMKKETKKTMAEQEKEIAEIRKKFDLSEDEFLSLMQGGDSKELAKEIHKDLGFWKRKITRIKSIQEELEDVADLKSGEVRNLLLRYEADSNELGRVLGATMIDNQILRETVVADLRKDEMPKNEAGLGFGEMKKLTDEDYKKAREDFEKEMADQNLDIDGMSNEKYQQEAERFSRAYLSKATKNKKGWWARIWESICAPKLADSLKRKNP